MPSFTQVMELRVLRHFDLFVGEEMVLEVGTNRAKIEDLQDPTISFDQDLKMATPGSRVSRENDVVQHDDIMVVHLLVVPHH